MFKALAPVIDGVCRVMVENKNKLAVQADAKKRKGKGGRRWKHTV